MNTFRVEIEFAIPLQSQASLTEAAEWVLERIKRYHEEDPWWMGRLENLRVVKAEEVG